MLRKNAEANEEGDNEEVTEHPRKSTRERQPYSV